MSDALASSLPGADENPELVAGLVFRNGGDEMLLGYNTKYGKLLVSPIGGKVEEDDPSPEHALRREFKEETGSKVFVTDFVDTYSTNSVGEGGYWVRSYICRIVDKEPEAKEDKVPALNWFRINDLDAIHEHNPEWVAANMIQMISHMRDNYRYFGLWDMEADVSHMNLYELIFWYKTFMSINMRQVDPSKPQPIGYRMPITSVMVNESPEAAMDFFKLARKVRN